MRNSKTAGDAVVVLRINAQKVGATCNHKVRFGLDAADILRDQQRRLDHAPEFLVHEGRFAVVAHGIFVPKIVGLIASPAHIKRVRKFSQLVCRIEHQAHPITDHGGHMQNVLSFFARIAIVPSVNLVCAKAQVVALLCKICVGFLAIESRLVIP